MSAIKTKITTVSIASQLSSGLQIEQMGQYLSSVLVFVRKLWNLNTSSVIHSNNLSNGINAETFTNILKSCKQELLLVFTGLKDDKCAFHLADCLIVEMKRFAIANASKPNSYQLIDLYDALSTYKIRDLIAQYLSQVGIEKTPEIDLKAHRTNKPGILKGRDRDLQTQTLTGTAVLLSNLFEALFKSLSLYQSRKKDQERNKIDFSETSINEWLDKDHFLVSEKIKEFMDEYSPNEKRTANKLHHLSKEVKQQKLKQIMNLTNRLKEIFTKAFASSGINMSEELDSMMFKCSLKTCSDSVTIQVDKYVEAICSGSDSGAHANVQDHAQPHGQSHTNYYHPDCWKSYQTQRRETAKKLKCTVESCKFELGVVQLKLGKDILHTYLKEPRERKSNEEHAVQHAVSENSSSDEELGQSWDQEEEEYHLSKAKTGVQFGLGARARRLANTSKFELASIQKKVQARAVGRQYNPPEEIKLFSFVDDEAPQASSRAQCPSEEQQQQNKNENNVNDVNDVNVEHKVEHKISQTMEMMCNGSIQAQRKNKYTNRRKKELAIEQSLPIMVSAKSSGQPLIDNRTEPSNISVWTAINKKNKRRALTETSMEEDFPMLPRKHESGDDDESSKEDSDDSDDSQDSKASEVSGKSSQVRPLEVQTTVQTAVVSGSSKARSILFNSDQNFYQFIDTQVIPVVEARFSINMEGKRENSQYYLSLRGSAAAVKKSETLCQSIYAEYQKSGNQIRNLDRVLLSGVGISNTRYLNNAILVPGVLCNSHVPRVSNASNASNIQVVAIDECKAISRITSLPNNPEVMGCFMGRKGMNVAALQRRFHVHINVASLSVTKDNPQREVKVIGDPKDVKLTMLYFSELQKALKLSTTVATLERINQKWLSVEEKPEKTKELSQKTEIKSVDSTKIDFDLDSHDSHHDSHPDGDSSSTMESSIMNLNGKSDSKENMSPMPSPPNGFKLPQGLVSVGAVTTSAQCTRMLLIHHLPNLSEDSILHLASEFPINLNAKAIYSMKQGYCLLLMFSDHACATAARAKKNATLSRISSVEGVQSQGFVYHIEYAQYPETYVPATAVQLACLEKGQDPMENLFGGSVLDTCTEGKMFLLGERSQSVSDVYSKELSKKLDPLPPVYSLFSSSLPISHSVSELCLNSSNSFPIQPISPDSNSTSVSNPSGQSNHSTSSRVPKTLEEFIAGVFDSSPIDSAKVLKVLKEQEFDLEALLEMNRLDLTGLGMLVGPAIKIVKYINMFKDGKFTVCI